jgi:uncharacterized protein (UPF0212 family)
MAPRAFDSDIPTPQLRFVENVDCDSCGTTFEGIFLDADASLTVDDMVNPPLGVHECPCCQHTFETRLTGWSFYSEPG